jgi:hypothetical protein
MIFYFSGCGNSRFIAESIAQAINEPLVFIPDAERREGAVLLWEVLSPRIARICTDFFPRDT